MYTYTSFDLNFHMQIELPIYFVDVFLRLRRPRMRRKVIAEEGAKRAEDRRQSILDQQEVGAAAGMGDATVTKVWWML